jgi:hypothetical protein
LVDLSTIPIANLENQTCHRVISSKFPPVALFDDVADADGFDAIYAVQAITNPRLNDTVGNLALVPKEERPFGINGCSYALAPFLHINQNGSRFSSGNYGVLYAAKDINAAVAETRYHQEQYFKNVEDLKYDNIVMRGLRVTFSADLLNISFPKIEKHGWYHPTDYSKAQELGFVVKQQKKHGIMYDSVRCSGVECYALFSPILVSEVVQTDHYNYVWDGSCISSVDKLANP